MAVRSLLCCFLLIEAVVLLVSYLGSTNLITEAVSKLSLRQSAQWIQIADETQELDISKVVELCMKKANFHSQALIEPATANAEYFYTEFRKAIPESPLAGYRSHCWKSNYSVEWDKPNVYDCQGNLGDINFSSNFNWYYPYHRLIFPYMRQYIPNNDYKTSIVCLPNIFVMGFPKCGSTFLYHVVDSLISLSSNNKKKNQVQKETQFWVHFDPFLKNKISVPRASDLGGYLFNFIPGLEKVSKGNDSIMVDGTPTYINEWPLFTEEESNLTNYCLIPSTLPRLLPNSKYFAIMRNPISMLYSNFWFSCTKNHIPIDNPQEGPEIFHSRVVSKINKFNQCMSNLSEEDISFTCTMLDKRQYKSCINKRLHLLDKCTTDTLPEIYTSEMPHCGDIWLSTGLFYVHVRKWLNILPRNRIKFMTLENINKNSSLAVHSILEFLELNITLADDVRIVRTAMASGKSHSNSQNTVSYHNDSKLQMKAATREILEIFYHPFNSLLAELLGDSKFYWF